MDLRHIIYNARDKSLTCEEEQRQFYKQQPPSTDKLTTKQREELNRFRNYVKGRLLRFTEDDRWHIEFQPLGQVHRSIIHELANASGFIAMSFLKDTYSRYCVVYKRQYPPSKDEIAARQQGQRWSNALAKAHAQREEYLQYKKQKEMKREAAKAAKACAGCKKKDDNKDAVEGAADDAAPAKTKNKRKKDKHAKKLIKKQLAKEKKQQKQTETDKEPADQAITVIEKTAPDAQETVTSIFFLAPGLGEISIV